MIMMLQTLQRGNVAFLWTFYSKPLINKTRDLLKVEEQPENTIILSLNIHYKLFDVPKFGHVNEFKDLKLKDISLTASRCHIWDSDFFRVHVIPRN